MAINIIGEPLGLAPQVLSPPLPSTLAAALSPRGAFGAGPAAAAAAAAAASPHGQQQKPGSAAELAASMRVDLVTAQRIRDLQAQKAAAVHAEDYDTAKRLKGAVDRLRAVGEGRPLLASPGSTRSLLAVAMEDWI